MRRWTRQMLSGILPTTSPAPGGRRDGFSISFEGRFVKVASDGAKSLEYARQVWTEIVSACRQHDCYLVLGVSTTTVPLGTMEAYDYPRLFNEVGITHEFRIAWVELNDEVFDVYRFVDNVLWNRGFPGRVFSRVDEAEAWLLGTVGS